MRADKDLTFPASRDGEFPCKELTEKIIGAAFEVHRELGPGFLEKVYESALAHELGQRGIASAAQAPIPVRYKGQAMGMYYADLLVEDSVICEIKALDRLAPLHESQLLHYLKATGLPVGLLINFGNSRVQLKRVVRTR